MALSWLTALKLVPLAEVMQAAPTIVQGARKLFATAKAGAGDAPAQGGGHGHVPHIEAAIATLQSEQQASAELIRSLAEQNASIVAALDHMQKRVRALTVGCVLLLAASGALALFVLTRA